ncbi:hypothetical protein LEC33_22820 [Salmonella enterica]|nr:hypothetical protein [Salmonella enterica]MDJ7049158.1 hypothetical protein [Salmonella enterica]MDJ7338339.1 hypothetical protein [Salmonella enterica]
MFIHTDLLRAALCCVADETETRSYLRGVRITPTHIQATNGKAAVSMEHGADTDIDEVFIVHGDIPDDADGTEIGIFDGVWVAVHYQSVGDNEEERVGCNQLEPIGGRYPDFDKLLPAEPEPCDKQPIFASHLLALPYRMFGEQVPVRLKPYGRTAPCKVIIDPMTARLYGNPLLIIMPMYENVFEMCEEVMNEKGI